MTIVFERCQSGGAPSGANAVLGEAGFGIYAYLAPHNGMRRYYSANGEQVYRLTLGLSTEARRIVDFTEAWALLALLAFARQEVSRLAREMPGYQQPRITKTNIQRFGRIIELYVNQQFPEAVAYIVPHKGPGLPTGKQAVIRQIDAFIIECLS